MYSWVSTKVFTLYSCHAFFPFNSSKCSAFSSIRISMDGVTTSSLEPIDCFLFRLDFSSDFPFVLLEVDCVDLPPLTCTFCKRRKKLSFSNSLKSQSLQWPFLYLPSLSAKFQLRWNNTWLTKPKGKLQSCKFCLQKHQTGQRQTQRTNYSWDRCWKFTTTTSSDRFARNSNPKHKPYSEFYRIVVATKSLHHQIDHIGRWFGRRRQPKYHCNRSGGSNCSIHLHFRHSTRSVEHHFTFSRKYQ